MDFLVTIIVCADNRIEAWLKLRAILIGEFPELMLVEVRKKEDNECSNRRT